MLKEAARVVSVEEDGLWVETRRKSACHGCAAHASCGHALLDKLHPGRPSLIRLGLPGAAARQAGDIILGISGSLVLKLSLLFYLLPLAALLSGALLASLSGGGDASAILGSLAGLGAGILAARIIGRRLEARPGFRPRILDEASASPAPPPFHDMEF